MTVALKFNFSRAEIMVPPPQLDLGMYAVEKVLLMISMMERGYRCGEDAVTGLSPLIYSDSFLFLHSKSSNFVHKGFEK